MPDITFVDQLVPVLDSGDYTITATQTTPLDPAPSAATRGFTVSGDRFTLPPDRVTAMFPPDGSMGDHHNVLPHIMLDRPTLPWERSSGVAGPWLVLLLFSADEQPVPAVVPLGDLQGGTAYHPPVTLEAHQSADDPVTVIDVPRRVLEAVLPAVADLPYLAHLRRTEGSPDTAVVLGSRLPPAGVPSTVHLVSMEGRYGADGPDLGPGGADSLIRLVSLASWKFACLSDDQTFATLTRDLAQAGSPFRPADSGDPNADPFLRLGYVPMRHALRQGSATVSWYRGPFVPGPVAETRLTATRTSDHLLRFCENVAMFDVGYAAAWELGRLLALQSTDFSTELYDWKRRRSQKLLRTEIEPDSGYPLTVPDIDDTMPGTVLTWLTGLAALAGVPLMYLIPDERLLPVESIRFLRLDRQWIHHLLDGAFSVGRLTPADADLDLTQALPAGVNVTTGALIRSDIVSGYPGLLVDGYATTDTSEPLPLIRIERLTPGILLCLFEGTLARLDVHQRPESLHFAVELPAAGRFGKTLRDSGMTTLAPLPLDPGGRLPIGTLAAAMASTLGVTTFGPGEFARQMIETAERISFLRS